MNSVNLTGRLTKTPELRYTTSNNTAVLQFTIAVDKRVKQGEEKQAAFINCVAWQKQAEFIAKWFPKGRMIAVSGRLDTRSWDDAEGKKHYVTEVVIENAEFCGDKNNAENSGSNSQGGNRQQAASSSGQPDGFYPLDEDDDLPF